MNGNQERVVSSDDLYEAGDRRLQHLQNQMAAGTGPGGCSIGARFYVEREIKFLEYSFMIIKRYPEIFEALQDLVEGLEDGDRSSVNRSVRRGRTVLDRITNGNRARF